jgi:hypothetical protein
MGTEIVIPDISLYAQGLSCLLRYDVRSTVFEAENMCLHPQKVTGDNHTKLILRQGNAASKIR